MKNICLVLSLLLLLLTSCAPAVETATVNMNYILLIKQGGDLVSVTYDVPMKNPPLYYINGAQIVPVYSGPVLQQDRSIYKVISNDKPSDKPLDTGISFGCRKTEPINYKISVSDSQVIETHQRIYDSLWHGKGSTYNDHELFQWICE